MKLWLLKWRISTALDSGKSLPESLRRKIATDPELERFTKQTEALGATLRNLPPKVPSLHGSIMRAVRASVQPQASKHAAVLSWWAAAGGAVALTVVCLYLTIFRSKPPSPQGLNGPVMVLELSETMPATVPSFVMAPLSNEWTRMDRDLQNTTQVLLANLP